MGFFIAFILICIPHLTVMSAPMKVPLEFYTGLPRLDGHPGHAPLMSEATFRVISDHIIDQSTEWFDPDIVKQGDSIYLNIWYLPWFEKYVHDQIKHPYVLISCDVGAWIPDPGTIRRLLYDPKLAAWFGRNLLFSHHPKLFQLPIGQNVYCFDAVFGSESTRALAEYSLNRPFIKKHLLYMNHLPRSFGDRDKIAKLFENEPYCFSRNHSDRPFEPVERKVFYEELASSQFVISPIGLETDCLRNWEALVLDCFPIVEHSFLDSLYEDLPIVIVHDWEEINEEFLRNNYEKLKHVECKKAYFEYWHQLIEKTQDKVRSNDLSFSQLEATLFNAQDLQNLLVILKKQRGSSKKGLCYKGA